VTVTAMVIVVTAKAVRGVVTERAVVTVVTVVTAKAVRGVVTVRAVRDPARGTRAQAAA
jgi:hypothetical protein